MHLIDRGDRRRCRFRRARRRGENDIVVGTRAAHSAPGRADSRVVGRHGGTARLYSGLAGGLVVIARLERSWFLSYVAATYKRRACVVCWLTEPLKGPEICDESFGLEGLGWNSGLILLPSMVIEQKNWLFC